MFGFFGLVGLLLWQTQSPWWTPSEPDPNWTLYKAQFIAPSGRVIDTGNDHVSHSEGQSWGMLLATHFDDQESFDQIWSWTRDNMQIRDDALLAWRWLPDDGDTGQHVPDQNNASDADLYAAWALLRAADQWGVERYRNDAMRMLESIKAELITSYASSLVLLPGEAGFEKEDHVILNLSYWVFPALETFAQVDADPVWMQLIESGHDLLRRARFGQWDLPADWIALRADQQIVPSQDFPSRFSYDAIRIPLLLAWAREQQTELYQPYLDWLAHAASLATTPAWVDLADNSLAEYPASKGFEHVFELTRLRAEKKDRSDARLSALPADQDYYSASLILLSQLAQTETAAP